jgi:CRISPR-associated endonuclease Csy4
MKYYLDITLLPEADITLGFIWQKVYQQVHIALVENKVGKNESAIAVSFPRYGEHAFPLGDQLRLFANEESRLTMLNISNWLSRFKDYVHIKSIKAVPAKFTYVAFVRQHVKGEARIERDMLKKAKRWSEKSGQPIEVCLAELEKSRPKATNSLPFIWLESQETKRRESNSESKFPLFIKKVDIADKQIGKLNCYGLSSSHNQNLGLFGIPQF